MSTVPTSIPDEGVSFREAFCQWRGIEPADFDRKLLWEVLFWRARLAFLLMRIFYGDAFFPERILVREVASKFDLTEIKLDIDFYQHKYVHGSFLRGTLKLRISGIQLQRLAIRAFRAVGQTQLPETQG